MPTANANHSAWTQLKKVELQTISKMDFDTELKQTVRRMYDAAARKSKGLLSRVPLSRGRELLAGLGYRRSELEKLPGEVIEFAFPCGNPLPTIRKLRPELILDLGCGSGLDVGILATSRQWTIKTIIGVDFSRELLAVGRRLHAGLAVGRLHLLLADLTALPFSGAYFDCINLNGSFNIIFCKAEFLRQAASLLRPGGHLLINDLLLCENLPTGFTDDLTNWSWNVAGSLFPETLTAMAAEAGLSQVHFYEHEQMPPVCRGEVLLRKKK
jgi:SAM-dependent methyltransferase